MSDIYLDRLKALRDFGIPLAEQKEAEGHLNFGVYMSQCGTYGCLLGWWATTERAKADGWEFGWGGQPHFNGISIFCDDQYFDTSIEDRIALFGGSEEGTLEDRKIYLETIIQRRSTPNTP